MVQKFSVVFSSCSNTNICGSGNINIHVSSRFFIISCIRCMSVTVPIIFQCTQAFTSDQVRHTYEVSHSYFHECVCFDVDFLSSSSVSLIFVLHNANVVFLRYRLISSSLPFYCFVNSYLRWLHMALLTCTKYSLPCTNWK